MDAEDAENLPCRSPQGDIKQSSWATKLHPFYRKGDFPLGMAFDHGKTAKKKEMSLGIPSLDAFPVRIVQPDGFQPTAQIRDLGLISDLHDPKDVGRKCSDDRGDRIPLFLGFASPIPQMSGNLAGHLDVILDVVGDDADAGSFLGGSLGNPTNARKQQRPDADAEEPEHPAQEFF
jgi:hypothetical protein